MKELISHLVGDYLLQSDWMAKEKSRSNVAAAAHAIAYTSAFLPLKPSKKALIGIAVTHYMVDRYRLAKYPVWAKNFLAPSGQDHTMTATGMPPSTPDGLANGLFIVADNTLHLVINHGMLRL